MINFHEMTELIKQKSAIIIDVRSRQEFYEGHINGAVNIPLIDVRALIRKCVYNKNQAIILYCNAGTRSIKAKKILEQEGYREVYVLEPMY